MSHAILDAVQRTRALDHRASFCVQAPAGSGKTELLTQRILKLLAHCERPEDILAFTFTRKAAAEMRKRLLDALEAAEALCHADGSTDTGKLDALAPHKRQTLELGLAVLQQDRLLSWNLLQNSQRLRINTIDSFTSWLTARLPLSAGFGARPTITTDMKAVFEEAVRLTLDSLDGNDASAEQVATLLRHQHGDLRRAETLLMQLLEKRDQWLPLLGTLRSTGESIRAQLEENLDKLLAELIDDAALRLIRFEQPIMQLLRFAANQPANKQAAALQACDFDHRFPPATTAAATAWQQLGKFFLTGEANLRKRVDIHHGFPAESHGADSEEKRHFKDMKLLFTNTAAALADAGLLPLLQRLAQMPPTCYGEQQWQVLADVVALLPLLAARLRTVMMAHGVIDHTESALAALQALGDELEPTDLALQLDYRIRHILVDEFQDTSSMQFRLLELLTAGWNEGDGRTLFIVGDGMQSCYGFRNANVGLFLRARAQVANVKMELLQLQVNFRSAPQVVDWVNAVFAGAFPAEDDIARGGVRYSASTARPDAIAGSGVHTRLFVAAATPDGDGGAQTSSVAARQHEAAAVAGLCSKLLAEHPTDSVAILVRNRGVLAAIVPALRRAGLRWSAEDIDPLLSYPPINDLFTLLRVLLNLADSTSWFALLRCPFVGLALADLETLALYRRQEQLTLYSTVLRHADIAGLSLDATLRLQRVVPLLVAARQRWQCMPLADLLEELWIELGGPACLDDAGMFDNIDDFLRLVEAASQHGDIRDIHQFETQLRRRHGSAQEPGVRLQIMTMHKAKGLEFDHVILPGLERRPRSDTSALLLWQEYIARDSHSRSLLALLGSKGDDSDPLHEYLKREAALRNRLEATRLLYIACTRAISSAWLFGTVKQTKNSFTAPDSSLLHGILPQLLQDESALQVQQEQLPAATITGMDLASTAQTSAMFRRLPADWRSSSGAALLAAPQRAEAPEPTYDVLAAQIGELVHRSLQARVEQLRRNAPAPAAIPALWRSRLRPLCTSEVQLDAALQQVAAQLQACVSGPDSAWLFHSRHSEDQCELALTDYSSGLRLDYSVDRTFVDAEGTRWIIDYKSSQPRAGQAVDEFLQEQTEHYRPQLAAYARLLKALDVRPQRCALYFTALPHLHLVSTVA